MLCVVQVMSPDVHGQFNESLLSIFNCTHSYIMRPADAHDRLDSSTRIRSDDRCHNELAARKLDVSYIVRSLIKYHRCVDRMPRDT